MSETELLSCPFCGCVEHLSVRAEGSMTPDMPARPYRVCCHHVDHDDVEGPIGYGRPGAIAAWNRRVPLTAALSAETEWHDILAQLNVTDDELIRIKNGIKGDGSVKIWSKMLYIILDNVLTLRRHAAAIRQRQGERS